MESLIMVRYEVKPHRVAENQSLVRAVNDELAATEPAGLGDRLVAPPTFTSLRRVGSYRVLGA